MQVTYAPRWPEPAQPFGVWSIAGLATLVVQIGPPCRTTSSAAPSTWSLANRYNLDLKRVIAAGHSAGGQLALWLAAQQVVDLRGVVPLAAVSDLRRAYALQLNGGVVGELLGGSPDRVPQRYAAASPIELLPIPAPQRVVHGTADNIVPFDMSQRFAKASKNAKLIPLPGAGHFDLIDPRAKVWPTSRKTSSIGSSESPKLVPEHFTMHLF